jgi:murein L,D-transpeptidase YcbB/YkuD
VTRNSIRTCLFCGALALALAGAAHAQKIDPASVVGESGGNTVSRVPLAAQDSPAPGAHRAIVEPIAGEGGNAVATPGPVQHWDLADARALYLLIGGIGTEGLDPADYDLGGLGRAIEAGEGDALDKEASRDFSELIEDLRDGRTPMPDRKQWFVKDPDAETMPTAQVMADALASRDIAGVVDKLAPTYPDYAALRQALAETPADDIERLALIRANMDRWRWLPHDLGKRFLLENVPEFELRLVVQNKVIRTYKTIVGKPGRTATPQFADKVEGIIFNPTWNVPQSIVVGEGLGRRVLNNPAWARSKGYIATRSGGRLNIVQQPGPGNALGVVKLDMPNPYSVFMHDTPSKQLFDTDVRAYSHGCIRTQNALELAMTLAIMGGIDKDKAVAISESGIYTKVPLPEPTPVYIVYFTFGRDVNGDLTSFKDIYKRDAPVLASFKQPRTPDRPRTSTEKAAGTEAPGA